MKNNKEGNSNKRHKATSSKIKTNRTTNKMASRKPTINNKTTIKNSPKSHHDHILTYYYPYIVSKNLPFLAFLFSTLAFYTTMV